MRCRTRSRGGLLADGEEWIIVGPIAVDREQVETEALAIARIPQKRNFAITIHAHLGAENNHRSPPLPVEVLRSNTEKLLGERGSEPPTAHHDQHIKGRRIGVNVDALKDDLAALLRYGLAALDRIKAPALVVGVNIGREPALQLLEVGLSIINPGCEHGWCPLAILNCFHLQSFRIGSRFYLDIGV